MVVPQRGAFGREPRELQVVRGHDPRGPAGDELPHQGHGPLVPVHLVRPLQHLVDDEERLGVVPDRVQDHLQPFELGVEERHAPVQGIGRFQPGGETERGDL